MNRYTITRVYAVKNTQGKGYFGVYDMTINDNKHMVCCVPATCYLTQEGAIEGARNYIGYCISRKYTLVSQFVI
jgi:hypothetical protein